MTDTTDDTEVVFNEPIPTLLVDGFQGAALINSILRINLFALKYDSSTEETKRHIVGTLAIPKEQFTSFIDGLYDIRKQLKEEADA